MYHAVLCVELDDAHGIVVRDGVVARGVEGAGEFSGSERGGGPVLDILTLEYDGDVGRRLVRSVAIWRVIARSCDFDLQSHGGPEGVGVEVEEELVLYAVGGALKRDGFGRVEASSI